LTVRISPLDSSAATHEALKKLGGRSGDGPLLYFAAARDTDSRYRIQPGYLLDLHLLTRLRARARSRGNAGAEDLRTALTLVRGRPLTGADSPNHGRDQYSWLGESSINPPHVLATIIDTAHHLAKIRLDQGDTAGARWAVQQAGSPTPTGSTTNPGWT
jgi:hypothetical protein